MDGSDDEDNVPNCNQDELVAKISYYSRRVEDLLLENRELRSRLNALELAQKDGAEERLPPRKLAKSSDTCSTSVLPSSPNATSANVSTSKKKSTNVQAKSGSTVVSAKPKSKRKVFQVIDNNVLKVRKNILDAGCGEFHLRQASVSAPVKVSVSADEADKVREALCNAKASFHEFKLAEEKRSCYLIKGLVGISESDLPEIKSQLMEKGLPNSIVLSFYITSNMKLKSKSDQNTLVKLVVPPLFDTNVLAQIKFLNHVGVRFEVFKSKSVIQCRNCQRFGHTAGGCQHPHRCVKCGGNHLRDACPRTHDKEAKLVCCNCGGEHTANNLNARSYYSARFCKNNDKSKSSSSPKSNINSQKIVPNTNNCSKYSRPTFAAVVSEGGVRASDSVTSINKKLMLKIDKMFSMLVRHDEILRRMNGDDV